MNVLNVSEKFLKVTACKTPSGMDHKALPRPPKTYQGGAIQLQLLPHTDKVNSTDCDGSPAYDDDAHRR